MLSDLLQDDLMVNQRKGLDSGLKALLFSEDIDLAILVFKHIDTFKNQLLPAVFNDIRVCFDVGTFTAKLSSSKKVGQKLTFSKP